MDITYQYPPELMQLLIDTIPLLFRSKKDELLFFTGAGVERRDLSALQSRVNTNPESINKYEIARTILSRLNERGESALGERREVLKRIIEFEDFSTCWPNDQLKAKGLVSEIRRVIDVKDSFTRMKQEREAERKKNQQDYENRIRVAQDRKTKIAKVKADLFALFSMLDARTRGLALETVLNSLFDAFGISIRDSFKIVDGETGTVQEQIDGAIEIDREVFLVEMKWVNKPVDVDQVSRHLVRIYHRGFTCGIFISNSGYTEPAINVCREALQRTVITLITLEELVKLLEGDCDLSEFLRKKIQCAILDKNPFPQLN